MPAPLAVFRALADPTRLRIVALLRQMELSVGELAQVLGQSQPRVSRHVKILADADLCDRRREGSWIFLGLGSAARESPLLAAIDGWDDPAAERWAIADAARLAAVRADRMASAEAYFDSRAADWDAIRSLHVAEAQVEGAILDLLGDHPLGRLVDIGTGTGRMIELLIDRATSAVGIDRSPEMLRLARAKVAPDGQSRAELRQGDMYALPVPDGGADTVVLHQVLHYAQAPAAAIAEGARTLGDDGRLLIVDFAAHDREDLRERDAHVRLGFDDGQIEGWFAAAGLALAASRELGGGELTVKLWLGQRRPESRHLKAVA
ncbi:metalloregulator ArsR/SmtB family transcription factor [Sphingomonas sp. AP4-R1]|uniref:ArsR/SmtB family transcription factor n=1 Tax=Sphingomonas sp. AP4-R1 TaxID=2735134 RepID=UPI0014935D00|nr:metalloregulator ArsR/SmtB family transcription factor [Sphingomonas sp. AP4-R1]QJU59432.1 metalloregulator ArsR/SmtB family transcription factor [Sphingomonas sp. AP4-R1]